MPDLAYRQEKIQQKRTQTSFRNFVMEICSWYPCNLYRVNDIITRYPDTSRKWIIIKDPSFISRENEVVGEYKGSFFDDFHKLYDISKKANVIFAYQNENTEFTDGTYGTKNGYLSFSIWYGIENVLYSLFVIGNCRNVVNSVNITHNSDNIFESKNVRESFNIFYSANISVSSDIRFCANMIGCHNCIDCEGLENKSYCINNQQYTKEEYLLKKDTSLRQKKIFPEIKTKVFANMKNINAYQCTWAGIINSSYITNGYFVSDAENSKNVVLFTGGESRSSEFYDGIEIGLDSHHCYANCWVGPAEHFYCGIFSRGSHNFYCIDVGDCSFCLWCMGIQNKQFCIFNKQYTKEERHEKVDEIFTQMEKDWTLWQFFPPTMNPFYFNDTAAYLIDPTFTQEEVEKAGYLRRSTPIKVDIPADADLVKVSELDQYETFDENGNRTINPAILQKVIQDEAGNARRIVKMEYDFLVKYALPLPRKHRLERMKENFKIE